MKNKYNKNPSIENKISYKKQRNQCVKLLKLSKKKFYNNLNPKFITDNKKFWKCIKPLFSDKQRNNHNITLVSGEQIITNDGVIAQTIALELALEVLNIKGPSMITSSKNHQKICKISNIIKRYEQHPSLIKTKENVNIAERFSFDRITAREIEAEIKSIDLNKASSSDHVSIQVFTSCSDIVSPFLKDISDTSFTNCEFPRSLKLADISPIHKKDETYKKEN